MNEGCVVTFIILLVVTGNHTLQSDTHTKHFHIRKKNDGMEKERMDDNLLVVEEASSCRRQAFV